uniref:F-box domain-containing protein n=1 Tax=Oryza glumipatula TaxID=40148 RepID=A0A0E0A514_9ORYZ
MHLSPQLGETMPSKKRKVELHADDQPPPTQAIMATPEPCSGRPWPDLPSELLGLVLLRLPSHADRVRLRAVCRPWRSSARVELDLLPPPLPWLLLRGGAFITLPDGAAHRLPAVPGDATHLASTGSGLLIVHGDGMLSLMNPSSLATTPLAALAAVLPKYIRYKYLAADRQRLVPLINKAVVSDNFTALLIGNRTWKVIVTIGFSPPLAHFPSSIVDIASFQGKLYYLTSDVRKRQEELYIFGVDNAKQIGIRCISSTLKDIGEESWFDPCSTERYVTEQYLVASNDRLLMVRRWINLPPIYPSDSGIVKRTRRFEVFEAADLSSGCGRWIKVDTLMGHALFVSKGCSKSLSAGAEEDCIYFMHEDIKNGKPEDPFLDSGVYNMRDGTVAPLLTETVVAEPLAVHGGPWCPTWLFPSET